MISSLSRRYPGPPPKRGSVAVHGTRSAVHCYVVCASSEHPVSGCASISLMQGSALLNKTAQLRIALVLPHNIALGRAEGITSVPLQWKLYRMLCMASSRAGHTEYERHTC